MKGIQPAKSVQKMPKMMGSKSKKGPMGKLPNTPDMAMSKYKSMKK